MGQVSVHWTNTLSSTWGRYSYCGRIPGTWLRYSIVDEYYLFDEWISRLFVKPIRIRAACVSIVIYGYSIECTVFQLRLSRRKYTWNTRVASCNTIIFCGITCMAFSRACSRKSTRHHHGTETTTPPAPIKLKRSGRTAPHHQQDRAQTISTAWPTISNARRTTAVTHL